MCTQWVSSATVALLVVAVYIYFFLLVVSLICDQTWASTSFIIYLVTEMWEKEMSSRRKKKVNAANDRCDKFKTNKHGLKHIWTETGIVSMGFFFSISVSFSRILLLTLRFLLMLVFFCFLSLRMLPYWFKCLLYHHCLNVPNFPWQSVNILFSCIGIFIDQKVWKKKFTKESAPFCASRAQSFPIIYVVNWGSPLGWPIQFNSIPRNCLKNVGKYVTLLLPKLSRQQYLKKKKKKKTTKTFNAMRNGTFIENFGPET